MANHIRIRHTMTGSWIWELVTSDGHVAGSSGGVPDRDACEAEALEQRLPVKGLRRGTARLTRKYEPGVHVYSSPPGLWRWRNVDASGTIVAAGRTAFLTKAEAQADAERAASIVQLADA
jgi:hypothetical protein